MQQRDCMNISVAHLLGTFQAFGVLISILNGFTFFFCIKAGGCFKASVDRRMGESFFCLLPLVLLLGGTRNAPPSPCNRLLATIFRFRPYVIRDNGGQKISCKFNAKLRQLS